MWDVKVCPKARDGMVFKDFNLPSGECRTFFGGGGGGVKFHR